MCIEGGIYNHMTTYDEQLKILFERERKIKLICAELNNFTNLKSTLSTIIQHIKKSQIAKR